MGDTSETNTKVLSRELFLGVVALKRLYRKIIICAIRSLFSNPVTIIVSPHYFHVCLSSNLYNSVALPSQLFVTGCLPFPVFSSVVFGADMWTANRPICHLYTMLLFISKH